MEVVSGLFNQLVSAEELKPTKNYDQPFYIPSLILKACLRRGQEQSEFLLLGELWEHLRRV